MASNDGPEDSIDLADYRWKNRLLLLFAPAADHGDFAKQKRAIEAEPAGMADRDLMVFELLEQGISRLAGQPLDAAAARGLRSQFAIPQGAYTLLLIGKDGTVKRRAGEYVPLADLFAQIDAMPMRRQEMRRKSGGD